tara:strand:+ start:119 stop:619 length:501 start_codon:yes stop_codon:yes gene_type:complete
MNEIKKEIINKSNILSLVLVVGIFLMDRISKIKVINHILNNNSSIYINDYLNLDLVWNQGIGFGFFHLEPGGLYHSISLIIFCVILVLIFFITKSTNMEKFLYSLILGGALGNFYDRILYFSVPDFIDVHFKDYHWFTFNIADIFISLGIILFILKELTFRTNEKN